MGKAAENEKIKLRANFESNVAVAVLTGGVALPFLALYAHYDTFFGADSGRNAFSSFLLLVGAGFALAAARSLYNSALKELDKIED